MADNVEATPLLICLKSTCAKALAARVPFCPYCGTKQASTRTDKNAAQVSEPTLVHPEVAKPVRKPLEPAITTAPVAPELIILPPSNTAEPPQSLPLPVTPVTEPPAQKTRPTKSIQVGQDQPPPVDNHPPRPPVLTKIFKVFIAFAIIFLLAGAGFLLLQSHSNNSQFDAAQNAIANRDLTAGNKELTALLKSNPEHIDAQKLNKELQARLANHRNQFDQARRSATKGNTTDALKRLDTLLIEDHSNSDAANLKKQLEETLLAGNTLCREKVVAGMKEMDTGNLKDARTNLRAARATATNCEGIRELSSGLDELARREAEVARAQAPVSITPQREPTQADERFLLDSLQSAMQQIRNRQWSTGKQLAQQVKRDPRATPQVQQEADRVIVAAEREKQRQASGIELQ